MERRKLMAISLLAAASLGIVEDRCASNYPCVDLKPSTLSYLRTVSREVSVFGVRLGTRRLEPRRMLGNFYWFFWVDSEPYPIPQTQRYAIIKIYVVVSDTNGGQLF